MSSRPEKSSEASIFLRLIVALAMVPVVPATAIGLNIAFDPQAYIVGWDSLRCFHGLLSVFWIVAAILIWRGTIIWTMGRTWLTAIISLIPFVQVAYAQPLWDAGCISSDFLRLGQHELGIGFWTWITIWAWWGWERREFIMQATNNVAPRVSGTARRIIASIGSIPLVFGTFIILAVWLESQTNDVAVPFVVTGGIAIAVWVLIWHRAVEWNRWIVIRTAMIAAVTIFLPIVVLWSLQNSVSGWLRDILLAPPVVGWGMWMIVTAAVWPIRRSEGSDRSAPVCPTCSYSLQGLTSTRCPECGSEPTLEELWLPAV